MRKKLIKLEEENTKLHLENVQLKKALGEQEQSLHITENASRRGLDTEMTHPESSAHVPSSMAESVAEQGELGTVEE